MPGAFIAADLASFFNAAEFATAASWTAKGGSAVAADVIFDAPGDVVIDGVYSTDYSVLYRTSIWPTVREGDTVTVGTAYKVRSILVLDDGLTARAFLSKRA